MLPKPVTLTLSLGNGEGDLLAPERVSASGERIKVRGCRTFQVVHE